MFQISEYNIRYYLLSYICEYDIINIFYDILNRKSSIRSE